MRRRAVSSRARHTAALGVSLAVVLAGVVASAASASPVTIAEGGSGAGQVERPISVGVDQASGAVFVADSYNNRVDEFSAGGKFVLAWGFGVRSGAEELQVCTPVTGCRAGIPTGELQPGPRGELGSFDGEEGGLAVDPLAAGESAGDVWVSDRASIQEFKVEPEGGLGGEPKVEPLREIAGGLFAEHKVPLAVDGAGDLWAGDSEKVQEFEASGVHKATLEIKSLGETQALAVDESAADVYVIGSAMAEVREYEVATGKQVGSVDATGEPQTIALDAAGYLFVGGECGSSFLISTCPHQYSLKEYGPTGVQVEQFGTGQVLGDPGGPSFGGGTDGIAVDSDRVRGAALYSASDETPGGGSVMAVQRFSLPEASKPLPEDERANGVFPTSATVEASLDPESHPTTYRFEYGAEPGVYNQTTETKALSNSGFTAETVSAHLTGLLPETTYYFRLSATSSEGTVDGEGASFTTSPAVLIESESVQSVSSDSASFEGVLNPQGLGAEWWVEYGTQEGAFDHTTAKQRLPAGSEGVGVSVHVQGLQPSTAYHYRFVASDAREGQTYTSYGRPLSFTTQAAGPSFMLLDGRGWEMVSPLEKQGASFAGDGGAGAINDAAANGDGITYAATASIEPTPPGEPALEDVQVLSEHGSSGWRSLDIASPHEQEWLPRSGHFSEFYAFTPDLSVGLVEPRGSTLLGGASERTPYLRRQALCKSRTIAGECYLPLVTAEDVTSGEKWGGEPDEATGEVSYESSTPDLRHVVLHSKVPLVADAKGAGVYEWSAGRLELVSVLPGEPGVSAGGCPRVSEEWMRHVISVDGDRVIWGDVCEGHHLYMHEAATHETVQLDMVQSGATGANQPRAEFEDASRDASRVFFVDDQQLTSNSHAGNGAPDLYVYEANADGNPAAGVVRDITVTVRNGEAANVLGAIPGVTEDGSVAYVIASGVLTEAANERGEAARSGQPNLYRLERIEAGGKVDWTPTFIVTLAGEDAPDWGPFPKGLEIQTSRLSPDGGWLAFMSDRPLTGYDNRDAASGQRDEEVFLYDAASRHLVCASCNPSGGRPHGVVSPGEASLLDKQNIWEGRWLAAAIPGWDVKSGGEGVYQPRYLSDGGRLFVNSVDALVPQDVNGTSDVYEYEPAGVGSCTIGSDTYHTVQGGCIGLISSGTSSEESVFLDASESGDDAFFLTAGKLVAADTDNAYDVYDAHVCGPGWDCPPPVTASPPCTNTASCRTAPAPQPSVFGALGSATFAGAVNHTSITRPKRTMKCRTRHVRRRIRCAKWPRGTKRGRNARRHRRGK